MLPELRNLNSSMSDDELNIQLNVWENNIEDDFIEMQVRTQVFNFQLRKTNLTKLRHQLAGVLKRVKIPFFSNG